MAHYHDQQMRGYQGATMTRKVFTVLPGVRCREDDTRKLKNGRADRYFFVRYRDPDGKQREDGLGWASEGWSAEKAQGVLGELKKAARTGEGPRSLTELRAANLERQAAASSAADDLTVAEFFDDYYVPAVKRRKRTWSHDKGRFDKGIRERLGDIPFRALAKEHMEELMDALRSEGLAESTVLQYMAILRQMFSLAKITMINGMPLWASAISPVNEVELPEGSEERERFLSYDEADALIAAARSLPVEGDYVPLLPELVDLIQLALNTGLRFGELMRLEWSDVSLQHAFLTVRIERRRKTGGHVPLNEEALEVLRTRNRRRRRGDANVFPPDRTGKGGCVLRRLYAMAVDAAGLNHDSTGPKSKVVFHTLRHTFGSWLAIGGTDIYRIKTLMRHKTIKMTMRYAHLLPDATRDAVNHLRPTKC